MRWLQHTLKYVNSILTQLQFNFNVLIFISLIEQKQT